MLLDFLSWVLKQGATGKPLFFRALVNFKILCYFASITYLSSFRLVERKQPKYTFKCLLSIYVCTYQLNIYFLKVSEISTSVQYIHPNVRFVQSSLFIYHSPDL